MKKKNKMTDMEKIMDFLERVEEQMETARMLEIKTPRDATKLDAMVRKKLKEGYVVEVYLRKKKRSWDESSNPFQ